MKDYMMAGINTPATENGVTAPKWNFVRTHTARRSAGTNLDVLDFIAKLGGWNKLDVLKKYLLESGLAVAKVVAEYDFSDDVGLKLKKILFCKKNLL